MLNLDLTQMPGRAPKKTLKRHFVGLKLFMVSKICEPYEVGVVIFKKSWWPYTHVMGVFAVISAIARVIVHVSHLFQKKLAD